MSEPVTGSPSAAEEAPAHLTVVVLAAGEGTRMRSATPKVLHGFAGRSLLAHVLAAAAPLAADTTAVVVGHGRDRVIEALGTLDPQVLAVVQEAQLGTAHAVRIATEALATAHAGAGAGSGSGASAGGRAGARAGVNVPPAAGARTVLVLPGDTPLLSPQTLADLLALHHQGAAATVLTSRVAEPTGYGRVVRGPFGEVERIVEQRDATAQEQAIDEVSALVYAFDADLLTAALARVDTDNAQGEFYLPDVIALLRAGGHRIEALLAPDWETAGVNDRVQLAVAAGIYRDRLVEAHQRAGVTILDPKSVWIDAGVQLGRDVTLGPWVQLHGATAVDTAATVGPDCTLTDTTVGAGSHLQRTVCVGARIGRGVTVGPFAYLRPGTVLADEVHVGTYVEIKNADVGAGAKVPHLTYVGDASIGTGTNIGASSVFVNYDGVSKHRTRVGNHARTGADTMFVAPVTIGDGAYTAAGSVITQDVPPGALAVARGRQRNVDGWVGENRPGTPAAQAAAAAGPANDTQPEPAAAAPAAGEGNDRDGESSS